MTAKGWIWILCLAGEGIHLSKPGESIEYGWMTNQVAKKKA